MDGAVAKSSSTGLHARQMIRRVIVLGVVVCCGLHLLCNKVFAHDGIAFEYARIKRDEGVKGTQTVPLRGAGSTERMVESGALVRVKQSKDSWRWVEIGDFSGWIEDRKLESVEPLAAAEEFLNYGRKRESQEIVSWVLDHPPAGYETSLEGTRPYLNAFVLQTRIYLMDREFDKAQKQCRAMIEIGSNEVGTKQLRENWLLHGCICLGDCFAEMRSFDHVLTAYSTAIEFGPNGCCRYLARVQRAKLYEVYLGDTESAEQDYKMAFLQRRSDKPLPTHCLIEFLASTPAEKYRNGERALELAQSLPGIESSDEFESDPSSLNALAISEAECGDFRQAKMTIGQALDTGKLPAEDRDEYEMRQELFARRLPYRQPVRKLSWSTGDVGAIVRERVHPQQRDNESGELQLGEIVEVIGSDSEYVQVRAGDKIGWIAAKDITSLEEAEQFFGKWSTPASWFARARVRLALGWTKYALRDYDRCIEASRSDARSVTMRAWVLATTTDAKLRNPGQAIEDARQAIVLSGGDIAPSIRVLAAAYAASGDFEQAVRNQQKVVQLMSDTGMAEQESAVLALYQERVPRRELYKFDTDRNTQN